LFALPDLRSVEDELFCIWHISPLLMTISDAIRTQNSHT
jgi:hypothetical protein